MKKKFNWHVFRIGLYCGLLSISIPTIIYLSKPIDYPKKISMESPNIIQPEKKFIKIIQRFQPKLDQITVKEIVKAVLKYSKEYNFPPELIIAIIKQESSFKPLAVSSANCVGLMQINRKMHKEKLASLNIKGAELFHIDNNIHTGCMILHEYFMQTKTISDALTKYLGINSTNYHLKILSSFIDLIIKQDNFTPSIEISTQK